MPNLLLWVIGIAVVFAVNVLQLVMPFAFDFVSTLWVFGVGVYIGVKTNKHD